jgi:hypothetical protein
MVVNSLEGEARLDPLGRLLMVVHLQGLLETRLRLRQNWRKNQRLSAPSAGFSR